MNRKRKAKQFRKLLMRMGAENIRTEVGKTLDDEEPKRTLPKKEWGYSVDFTYLGYHFTSCDDSWYEAWKGAKLLAMAAFDLKMDQMEGLNETD